MDFLVDKSQAGFVPGRLLNDNILLGHELVKGYCWKGVSPRCMVKIDMQKAYDSLEWVFLEQVLTATNIPSQFLKWIMTCVSTVSYSIMINAIFCLIRVDCQPRKELYILWWSTNTSLTADSEQLGFLHGIPAFSISWSFAIDKECDDSYSIFLVTDLSFAKKDPDKD
uniref:Reverse transcriptase domain-containing protein n=2 Tax=Nicotiana TaxID=4085 RepID=A0A1S4CQB8_TOBAC|nr:PREDICTED: uncharacterized protein LOC104218606 [Nicotiana sylvestris]XP_016503251.1 PREDICTED: uncharacterized protein LOC107821332 [Nicotiana tabacum]